MLSSLPATKVCSDPECGFDQQPASAFWNNSKSKDGLEAQCKACMRNSRRARLGQKARVSKETSGPGLKVCSNHDCTQPEKSISEFWGLSSSKDGLAHRCKTCARATNGVKNPKPPPLNIPGMKRCTDPACLQPVKPLEQFHKSPGAKANKDGRLPVCRDCRARKRNTNGRVAKPLVSREGYKVCSKHDCAEREKPLSEFGKDSSAKDGRRGECKDCRKKEHDLLWVNPEYRAKQSARTRRRSVSKLGVPTEVVELSVLQARDSHCYLCTITLSDTGPIEQDHIIALSRTELNPTHTYDNMALTHLLCNREKHAKTPTEYWAWNYERGYYDDIEGVR